MTEGETLYEYNDRVFLNTARQEKLDKLVNRPIITCKIDGPWLPDSARELLRETADRRRMIEIQKEVTSSSDKKEKGKTKKI
jgi:hypothetical protein